MRGVDGSYFYGNTKIVSGNSYDAENMTVDELDREIERMKKLLELAELRKKVEGKI